MQITESEVVARYAAWNGDIRDAYWWFLNGRIAQHENKTPHDLFYESEDGPVLVCKFLYLLTNGLIKPR